MKAILAVCVLLGLVSAAQAEGTTIQQAPIQQAPIEQALQVEPGTTYYSEVPQWLDESELDFLRPNVTYTGSRVLPHTVEIDEDTGITRHVRRFQFQVIQYFGFDSDQLYTRRHLGWIAERIAQAQAVAYESFVRVDIVALTDHLGTTAYNQDLSERRLSNTIAALEEQIGLHTDELSAIEVIADDDNAFLAVGEKYPVIDIALCEKYIGEDRIRCLQDNRLAVLEVTFDIEEVRVPRRNYFFGLDL